MNKIGDWFWGKKNCPVCDKEFNSRIGHKREKQTCGYSCSNKHFNGKIRNIHLSRPRAICFRSHEKKCIVCGEERAVTVHHWDENRENNSPENLIPICPNHHLYVHSRFRYLVIEKIDRYREEFIRGIAQSGPECLLWEQKVAGSNPVSPT